MKLLRRYPVLLVLFLLALTAAAFQVVSRAVRQRDAAETAQLAALAPQGALLAIESPDFAALLAQWNQSSEQQAWLKSDNYSVFSNSRLFSRLSDAQGEFANASGVPADKLLAQVAGRQSLFAWYDIGRLEFLYITRMSATQAAATDLLQHRTRFQARSAGGVTFYVRSSGSAQQKRTVAFASAGGLFLLSTREDLMAGALENLARSQPASASANALTGEPWFQQAEAATHVQPGATPMLHMVLNLERIVPMPYFRSYWVQQNVTQMKQYRAAVTDLYKTSGAFREERALLLNDAAAEAPVADRDLAPLLRYTGDCGYFRATSTDDPDAAVAALSGKILGQPPAATATSTAAPDAALDGPQAGTQQDLEVRIDQLPPLAAAASDQPLRQQIAAAGLRTMLVCSGAVLPGQANGLWVPLHSVVVLEAQGSWNPQQLAAALESSLRGSLTAGTLGIEFHESTVAGEQVFALSGPRPLLFSIRGNQLLLADDAALLSSVLAAKASAGPVSAAYVAGFDHQSQSAPYSRLTALIDGTNQPAQPGTADAPAAPAFFSQNLRSLSDTFQALASERMTERHTDGVVRQTVVYQWTRP